MYNTYLQAFSLIKQLYVLRIFDVLMYLSRVRYQRITFFKVIRRGNSIIFITFVVIEMNVCGLSIEYIVFERNNIL